MNAISAATDKDKCAKFIHNMQNEMGSQMASLTHFWKKCQLRRLVMKATIYGAQNDTHNRCETLLAIESDDVFDVRRDAILLQNSLSRYENPNIALIIDILTHRNFGQRLRITEYLQTEFNIDLVAEFNKLPGYVKYLLTALMRHLPEFNANNLYENWIPHMTSKSNMLLPILSTQSAAEMQIIEEAYRQLKANIEYEIIVRLQSRLEEDETGFVDYLLNDDTINCEAQVEQLADTQPDHPEDFFYFAETLHRALNDLEPDIKTISAILTRRSKDEMLEIAKSYKVQYNKDLVQAFEEKLEGDSRDILIALVTPQPDFNKIWLPFADMPNIIFKILITSSDIEVETINKAYKRLFCIIEYTLQSLVQCGFLENNKLGAIYTLLGATYPNNPDTASNYAIEDLPLRCIRQRLQAVNTIKLQHECSGLVSSVKRLIDSMTFTSHAKRNEIKEDNERDFQCGRNQHNRCETLLAIESDNNFDVRRDAILLQNSLSSYKSPNIALIIDILTHRNFDQRLRITEYLQTEFNIDLVAEFNKLPGYVKYLLTALMRHLPEFNANNLYENWIPHMTSKSNMLLPILSTLSAAEMQIIEEAYRQLKANIEYEIILRLQGRLEEDETGFVDYILNDETTNGDAQMEQLADTQPDHPEDFFYFAETLHRALNDLEPDIKTISAILTHRRKDEILEIAKTYKVQYNKDLVQAFEENLEGDSRDILIALVTPQPDFNTIWLPFAEVPHIIFDILTTSSDVEVETINKAYKRLFSIIEYTLQSLVQCGFLEDNKLGAIYAVLEGSYSTTPVFNCNENPTTIAGNMHNVEYNQQQFEETLIEIFANCRREQRLAFVESYNDYYGTHLEAHLNSLIKDNNLRAVIQALLTPFPRFNNRYFYNYLMSLIKHPQAMLNALNDIPDKLKDQIFATYDQLRLAMEQQLLIVLKYHLWESNSPDSIYYFIEKVRNVNQHGNVDSVHSACYKNSVKVAKELHSAMGYEAIIKVLATLTYEQRTEIVETFKYLYKMDLASVLISRLKDQQDLQDIIIAWLTPFVPINGSALFDNWLDPAISSSYIMRNIKSTFSSGYIKELNEQLQLNMDEILLPLLLRQKHLYIADTGDENQNDIVNTCDAGSSARSLYQALKDNNEQAIMENLIHCSYEKRIAIAEAFKHIFGKTFLQELLTRLPSNLAHITKALMTQWPELYAEEIHRNSKRAIMDTIVTSSDGFLRSIRKSYNELYSKPNFEELLHNALPEVPEEFVTFLIQGQHNEDMEFNAGQSEEFIEMFGNTNKYSFKMPEVINHLIWILTTNSEKNLHKMIVQYEMRYNGNIETSLKRLGTHGDFTNLISAKIRATKSTPKYYAHQLYDVMLSGTTTEKESAFNRIIIGHAGTDLPEIQKAFDNEYKTSLVSMIREQHDVYYWHAYSTVVEVSYSEFGYLTGDESTNDSRHQSQSHQNAPYDPIRYAKNLHKAVEAADKIATTEILINCSPTQRMEVVDTYQKNFTVNLLSDIGTKFNSKSDGAFHDVLVAYLTSLPDFNSLYSLNNWIPEADRSQVLKKLLASAGTAADIKVIRKAYEELKLYINSRLLEILKNRSYEDNAYTTIEETASQTHDKESYNSINVTNDVHGLSNALNANVIDIKVIPEILGHRTNNQLLSITNDLEEIYKTNLYDKNTSNWVERMRYLYIALLKPLPTIDGQSLFDSWFQQSKRWSKILDTVLNSTNNKMKALTDACTLLKDHIHQKMISTLQSYESKTYNPIRYAKNLHKAVEAADKIATTEILINCSPTQRMEVVDTYQKNFTVNLLSDIGTKFNSKSDGAFHDVLVAYLTSLPDFNSLYSLNNWIPEADRSQVLKKLLASAGTAADIKVIRKAYEELKLYINSRLLEILKNRSYEDNAYTTIEETASQTQDKESYNSINVTNDVHGLSNALNANVIDIKVIPEILGHRTNNQLLSITNDLEEIYKTNLYDKNTSNWVERMRYLYIALLKPLPTIDGQSLFDSWFQQSKRWSKILDIVLNSTNNKMKALTDACNLLKDHIHQKMISTLQSYESKTYNPIRYAKNLHKAVEAADKIATTEILINCSPTQRMEVVDTYQKNFTVNLLSDIGTKFNSKSDGPFHDVLVAYLTSLPDFNSLYSLNNWIPEADRSQVLKELLASADAAAEIRVIREAYEELKLYINSRLLEILKNRSYEDDEFTTLQETTIQPQAKEFSNSFHKTYYVYDLSIALNATIVDMKVITEILTNRTNTQRLDIANALEEIYKTNLYEKNTSKMEEKMHYLYIALLKPLPMIDGQTLIYSWMPAAKLLSNILDTVLNSANTQMKPLNEACALLKGIIEGKIISTLQNYEAEAYDPKRYAISLHNVIMAADKTGINAIVTRLNSSQRLETCEQYKATYHKDIISELKMQFRSSGDGQYNDITSAFLTAMPPFNVQDLYDHWVPMLKRTNVLYNIVNSLDFDFSAIHKAYLQLRLYVETELSKTLQDRSYEGNSLAKEHLLTEDDSESQIAPADSSFDASKDAQYMYIALHATPVDTQVIAKTLVQSRVEQRFKIAQAFEKLYNKILVLELDSKLEGNLHDVVIALMTEFTVDVRTLFSIWIPPSNRLSEIIDSIADSSSVAIKAFNNEGTVLKDAMEDKLISTMQQFNDQQIQHKEVSTVFPSINFDVNLIGNALFNLISAGDIDYVAITQLMSGFNNEQRLEIIKSLKLRNGNEVLLEFLSRTGKNPSQDVSIALLSPLPKFDKQEFFKQWFGSHWPQTAKKTHILLKILNLFSASEMSNFGELYKQLNLIIEYELWRKRSWEDNKYSPEKFNAFQAMQVDDSSSAENDASNLERAMSGAKIDYTAIIEFFVSHNSNQRLEIAKSFKIKFQRDLVEVFQNSLKGHFRDIIVALMTPPPEFYKTWMPLADVPNVVNNILATSYSGPMEAINKSYQRLCLAIENQLTIILKSRVWEGNNFQRINSLIKEPTGDSNQQIPQEMADQFAEKLNKVINSPDLQQTMIDIFKDTSINDSLQIAKSYKRLFKNDLVEELKSKNAPYFYDVMEALLTPFPEFNDDNFLRMLLPKANIENNELEILKFFSSTEIKAVRDAYTRLQFNTESNLKELSQNQLWESKKLEQINGFFKEMSDVTQVPPVNCADKLYSMWLPSSGIHDIWATSSSWYIQDLDDACERLQFYIQHRYKLFSSEEYKSLQAIDRRIINDLIGSSTMESQLHQYNYTEYAVQLHNTINVPTLNKTIMDIFIHCNAADIEAIAKSYERSYSNDLSKELDSVLAKDYFHDVVITLLKPFPEFNVEVAYKYWAQVWEESDTFKHNIQPLKAEMNTIKEAYSKLKLYVQNKILYILRNRLWEAQRFRPMTIFIHKISSGMQIHKRKGASSVPAGSSFYPGNDALTLSNALNDKIVRIRKIIPIIISRSHEERLQIAKPIQSLVTDLDSKLYGDLHNFIMALMTPYPVVNVQTLINDWSLELFGSTDTVDVLTSLSVDYIEDFNEACVEINHYLDSELKKALQDLPNPKCLKIKVSQATPSIRPADVYDPHEDAKILVEAVKKDKHSKIIEILTHRSYAQRVAIANVAKSNIIEELQSKLTYRFQDTTVALMTPWPEIHATALHTYSATHLDKPYGIIDFLATSSNANISDIEMSYKHIYPEHKMEDIVLSAFEGVAKDMAKDILNTKRIETEVVNESKADADATFLYELGVDRYFRTVEEEQRVASIFATRSRCHLLKIIELYESSFKECIEAAIKQRGLHKDLETLVLAIIHATKSTPDYYAERLYDALRGSFIVIDTNLIRIVVGRSDIDLHDIEEAFNNKYRIKGINDGLIALIKKRINGSYLNAIAAILAPKR